MHIHKSPNLQTNKMQYRYKKDPENWEILKTKKTGECLFEHVYLEENAFVGEILLEACMALERFKNVSGYEFVIESVKTVVNDPKPDPISIQCLFIQCMQILEFRDAIRPHCDEVRWFLALPFFVSSFEMFCSFGSTRFSKLKEFAEFCLGTLVRREYQKVLCFIDDSFDMYMANWKIMDMGQYKPIEMTPSFEQLSTFECSLFSYSSVSREVAHWMWRIPKKGKNDDRSDMIVCTEQISDLHDGKTWSQIAAMVRHLFENSYISNKKKSKTPNPTQRH